VDQLETILVQLDRQIVHIFAPEVAKRAPHQYPSLARGQFEQPLYRLAGKIGYVDIQTHHGPALRRRISFRHWQELPPNLVQVLRPHYC
jgi:hypothetical protein